MKIVHVQNASRADMFMSKEAADQKQCDICVKIICKVCGWEPSGSELEKIIKRELTACPLCGWSPG